MSWLCQKVGFSAQISSHAFCPAFLQASWLRTCGFWHILLSPHDMGLVFLSIPPTNPMSVAGSIMFGWHSTHISIAQYILVHGLNMWKSIKRCGLWWVTLQGCWMRKLFSSNHESHRDPVRLGSLDPHPSIYSPTKRTHWEGPNPLYRTNRQDHHDGNSRSEAHSS